MNYAWPPERLEDKIAQLIFVRIGSNLPPVQRASDDETRVADLLRRVPIGGLLLFNGSWPEVQGTLSRLQSLCDWPLLVGADIERGAGQQVSGLTVFPHARAFGALGDLAEERLGQFAEVTAREALAVGIHIAFAPVVDVDTNRENPIIATRALSDSPAVVAKLGAAYIRAAEGAGLMTTPKHFPGHGDTQQDSHDDTPSVPRDLGSLQEIELPPFRAAIDAGASLVMTAHVEYPALDPSGAPATLSESITTGLLRGELGFQGVACSDSLLMAGVRDRFESEGALAEATLRSGVDLLLDVADPELVVEHLAKRVRSGDLSSSRIDEAVRRVGVLKSRVPGADGEEPQGVIPATLEAANALSRDIAAEAVHMEGDLAARVDPEEALTVAFFKSFDLPSDPPEQPLAAALRERFSDVAYFEFGPEPDEQKLSALRASVREGRRLLVALVVKPAAWRSFGLSAAQQPVVDELVTQTPSIVASLGVRSVLSQFSNASLRVCTYSDVAASQIALAQVVRAPL